LKRGKVDLTRESQGRRIKKEKKIDLLYFKVQIIDCWGTWNSNIHVRVEFNYFKACWGKYGLRLLGKN